MLEGQGADEVFAGYNGYPLFMLKSFLERNELQKAISFFINAGKLPDKSHLHLLQSFVALLTPQTFLNLGRKIIGKENLTPSWINSKQLIEREDMNGYSFFDFSNEDLIGRRLIERLYLAQTYSGLPALLRHSDRNSMAHSIESRVPFLNKNISEYVFSLKESFLHSNEGITKNILRNSLQGIIPSQILNRKDKIGFATSEFQILQQNPSQLFNAIEILDRFRLFNKERLYKFMKTSLKKINNMDKTPWRILNLALWVEAYNISDD
jgi:asparagine synthase (glutamine-hydrolysing)